MKKITPFILVLLIFTISVKAQTTTTLSTTNIKGTATIDSLIIARDTIVAKKDIRVVGDLKVKGDVKFKSKFNVEGKSLFEDRLSIGSSTDKISLDYSPGTNTLPYIFKFIPTGSSNGGGGNGSGNDPTPNLACVLGLSNLIAFPNAISVHQTAIPAAGTGGNIIMGHTSAKAFIESYGGLGTTAGNLFINATCNRNVYLFNHATPFEITATNVLSVAGKVNVSLNMQIGASPAASFSDNNSRLFISSAVGSLSNGLRIKHGEQSKFGVKIATFNSAPAFVVTNSPNSITDGNENYRIDHDGKTTIGIVGTNNATGLLNIKSSSVYYPNAIEVIDNTTNNVNFRVKHTGFAYAREINVMPTSTPFPDYVFAKDYKLKSLENLESFIKENKHLPNIPSASEVAISGINVGEMQIKQMEKIEEAFLYIIQLKKENEELKVRLKKLESNH